MDDQPYTKRELDHFFTELKECLTQQDVASQKRFDHQDDMLSEIKMQTTKTNGRVNKIEFWISALKWTCGALWTLLLVLIPLLWHEEQLQVVHDSYVAVKAIVAEQKATNN